MFDLLSETAVSTILTASITGAGLVLAVYTLFIPLSRKYLSYRAEKIRGEIQELKDKVGIELKITAVGGGNEHDEEELWELVEGLDSLDNFILTGED